MWRTFFPFTLRTLEMVRIETRKLVAATVPGENTFRETCDG